MDDGSNMKAHHANLKLDIFKEQEIELFRHVRRFQ